MSLLPPEICPKKECSDVMQKPRSTLDALNPSDGKELASLPQSLLITCKDITQLLQSLINKKVKIEPGWVSNQSLEKDLGISLKFYRTHSQLFPSCVPRLDKDASLLDLSSSGNVSLPVKSLETLERLARNIPYGKKCTAANNFREQLANTLRLLGKHNLIWLTSIRGMFAR